MVSRLLGGSTDRGDTPYSRYIPLVSGEEADPDLGTGAKRVQISEASAGERPVGDGEGSRVVDVERRARSPSRLKNRLKQVKAEFSHEGKGVADAFIGSTENRPQHNMKDEASNDLLV